MRIAILTQPLRTNYGGILQNYALQTVLKRMGHDPITIDYDCRYSKWRWFLGRVKSMLTGIPHNTEYPHYGRSGQENLNGFIVKHITMTKPVDRPTAKVMSSIRPDVVIVGSDQVWNPMCNVPVEFMGNMFLDFIEDWNIKRLAYAVSFGSYDWNYTEYWERYCHRLALKFNAISVRESSGVKLCMEHFGVVATHVLDPTLLLTAIDYERLMLPDKSQGINFLFAYILDPTEQKNELLQEVASFLHLQLRIVGANENINLNDSVEKWLKMIKNAKYVVTDSFHGTVFSILFHIPFLTIINDKRGAERFYSLLNLVGLERRIFINGEYNKNDLNNTIDWSQVDMRLEEERIKCFDFIKRNL